MVSKTERILEQLRAGVPMEEIDDSSKSTYYKALDLYKSEADAIYTRITTDIKVAKSEKTAIDNEVAMSESERSVVSNALEVKKKDLERTTVTRDAAKKEADAFQAKSIAINNRLSDLAKRGITESTIEAVASTDVASPVELLGRVRTAAENQQLTKVNEELKAKNTKLCNDHQGETAKLETTKKQTLSEENKRDEFRRVNTLYLVLLDVLFDFFKKGYTADHFQMMLNGMKRLEILGQPKASVMRLLKALEKIRTLEELDSAIPVKEATLSALQGKVNELGGVINAYKNVAIAALNEVSGAATQQINELLGQYVASLNVLQDKMVRGLNAMSAATDADRATTARFFYNEVRNAKNEVVMLHSTVTKALQVYKDEVTQWGAVREESGRYEKLIEYTSALLAVKKDPNVISQLPPETIISLLKSIDIYVQTKLPDADSLPSAELYQRERWAFNSVYKAKIRSVSAWLLEDLTRRFYEGRL